MSLATFEKLTPIIEIFVPLDKFVVVKNSVALQCIRGVINESNLCHCLNGISVTRVQWPSNQVCCWSSRMRCW